MCNGGETYASTEAQWIDESVTIVDEGYEEAEAGLEAFMDYTGGA
jgi:hypothetical protein